MAGFLWNSDLRRFVFGRHRPYGGGSRERRKRLPAEEAVWAICAKLFVDTQLVPLAVNIAGELEVALDRASTRTGVRPGVILAVVAAFISFVMLGLMRNRKTAP